MKTLFQILLPAVVVAGMSVAAAQPVAARMHDNHGRMSKHHHMMMKHERCKTVKSKHWSRRQHGWVWTTKRICR
ncbi:MAG: hypothetical protein V4691_06520 [Pseudomonadota bacterium]